MQELHADDLVGTRRSPSDLRDRDRAGVGCERRRGLRDAIEIREDTILETAVLARGFDDERRICRGLDVHTEINSREDLYLFLGGDRTFLYLSLDILRHRGPALVERFLRYVDHHHLQSGLREDV